MSDDPLGMVLFILAIVFANLMYCAGEGNGEIAGRCIELCRPEKFVEDVNERKECLCTTKRHRLEKAP